ncbi:MAG: hypothetical protein AAB388_00065 [Patescibacteria group bacterium]
MNHKLEIAAFARKIFKHQQRGLREFKIIHPAREWLFGLSAVALLLLCLAAWNVFTFMKYSNTEVTGSVTPGEEVVVYKTQNVEAALTEFVRREEQYNQLLKYVPTPPQVEINETATTTETTSEASTTVETIAEDAASSTEIEEAATSSTADQTE